MKNNIELREGLTFRHEEGWESTIIFMSNDGYYCLCTCGCSDIEIYMTDTIDAWLQDGSAEIVSVENIKTTIKVERI